jgi:N-glycosylase/DNA lyase
MSARLADRVERAVAAIYPDIVSQTSEQARSVIDEADLWYELSCCVLSSQVPFGLAQAAALRIQQHGVLSADCTQAETGSALREILHELFYVDGKLRKYRFPIAKSTQLSEAKCRITRDFGSLGRTLSSFTDAEDLRRWLVDNAPGLGPKQASMLLRNTGATYHMAILDRHILAYMYIVGLTPSLATANSYSKYLKLEEKLKQHADGMGYSLGHFDWAIWIVMRVLNQNEPNRQIA